jgi:hypothetical protein
MHDFYEEFAIPAASFARAVAFAISQPDDVDVNEILFRPMRQTLQGNERATSTPKERRCSTADLEPAISKSRPSGSAAWA